MTTRAAVLVVSSHEAMMDRRVVSEANAAAASGRAVTLLETLPDRPEGLRPEIEYRAAARSGSGRAAGVLRGIVRRLPRGLRSVVRSVRYRARFGPIDSLATTFAAIAPSHDHAIIHCHDAPTLPAALDLRRKRYPAARVILDAHELFSEQFPEAAFRNYWRRVEERHLGEVDGLVAVNPSIERELAGRFEIPQTTVIYNSFEPSHGRIRRRRRDELAARVGDTDPGFIVVFQGYLTQDRNLLELVDAFGELGPEYRLYVFGEGPMERAMRRRSGSANLGNVFLGGWVPGAELIDWVSAADLGVIPYRGDYSKNHLLCTPNKLFEFIEAGIPVCASDLPELSRIVLGSGIGHVGPMTDAHAIAATIRGARRLIEDGQISDGARANAREQYGWERQAAELVRFYDAVEAGPVARREGLSSRSPRSGNGTLRTGPA